MRLAAASWGRRTESVDPSFWKRERPGRIGSRKYLEGWLRGRKQLLAKEPSPQGLRGFESHSFRHDKYGSVAKRPKAAAFYSDHRGFESHPTHHFARRAWLLFAGP